jgi:hypothetical protein
MEENEYWHDDLFPQTWEDVIDAMLYTFTNQIQWDYSHAHAERIRAMYWRLLDER